MIPATFVVTRGWAAVFVLGGMLLIVLAAKALVTGVGFFDFDHNQTGVAPNAVEIHPVTAITFDP